MATVEQRFMEALCELSQRTGMNLTMRLRPSDRIHVQSVSFDQEHGGLEIMEIELYLTRPNTDIDGTAVEVNPRELNA